MLHVIRNGLVCYAFCGFLFAGQCQNPRDYMIGLSKEVSEQAKASKNQDKLMREVSERLVDVADADYVVARVVGMDAFRLMSEDQRKLLKSLMAKQLVKGFVGALMQIDSGNELRFYPMRSEVADMAQVKALYRARSGAPVKLNFILSCVKDRWLIQDVSIDGVMVVEGYISQYKPIIKEKGIDGLIQFLRD